MSDDEPLPGPTYQQRVNARMRREIEEADQEWVRKQKILDLCGNQSLMRRRRSMMIGIIRLALWSAAIKSLAIVAAGIRIFDA